MAKHRKQHYVPQFYFRLFSEDKHNIHIFNLRKTQTFTGPFKKCAAENYFYSNETKLEESYSGLESKLSETIKKLLQSSLSNLTEDEYFLLLMFVLFQHTRTKREQVLVKEFTEKFVEGVVKPMFLASKIFKESGLSKSTVDELKITYPADHLNVILNGLLGVPLIHDLTPVILQNKTKKDFIFSDAPVVFYNMLLKSEKDYGTIGLQNIGLQIFCPLNKDTMLMLYDAGVYEIQVEEGFLQITKEVDVDAINGLQFFNCEENVFFSDMKRKPDISDLHAKLAPIKKQEFMLMEEKAVKPGGKLVESLHAYTRQFDYDMELSFVKISNDTFDRTARDPELINQYNDFTKELMRELETTKIKST